MSGFVKLDTGILDSSLWIEREPRSIFMTALLMAMPFELQNAMPQLEVRTLAETGWIVPVGWYGLVEASGKGIVQRDGMAVEAGLAALEQLCAPDPDSRSRDFDGRRMARVDRGYLILNYFNYRDKDYTAADRMRRLRARRKGESVTPNTVDVTPNVTQSDASADAKQSSSSSSSTSRAKDSENSAAKRQLRLRFENPLHAEVLDRFFARLESAGESIGRWLPAIEGWLGGLGMTGGKEASADDVALGLLEYLTGSHGGLNTRHVASFVSRAQRSRLKAEKKAA